MYYFKAFAVLLFVTFSLGGNALAGTPTHLFETGQLTAAFDASQSDGAESYVVSALFNLRDAKFDAALRELEKAEQAATTELEREWLILGRARLAREQNSPSVAESILRELLQARPQAHRARLELGEILMARGAKSEADLVLDSFSSFFNNGLLKTSVELALLSKAMAHLGSFQDANRAAQLSFEADPRNAENLVFWGELLLSKYNYHDADRTFKDALAVDPNHPGALVGLARVELAQTTNYNEVRNLLERASLVASEYPDLWTTYAQASIYDSDCVSAREHVQRVLKSRPHHLEARTLEAVCDYLDDKSEVFESRVKEILELNPRYADVFATAAEFAVRVHRYDEAVALDRRALEIYPGHARSLVGLGIGLSRIGKEDEALDVFRDAFDADPYNVRAFNMVELYEKKMPEYEFTDHGRFRIRAHQTQNEAINHLVAPLVDEAIKEFDKKYQHKTHPYLAVEVFPVAEVFAVRSVGVPNVSPQGICFGKVVVSRSPSEGNFNWAQVIWHELAHVYHLQISKSRVPRWFTEGLAEYETNVKDPAWSRHHDKELARALIAGELRGVMTLDKGFTQARTFEEILRSYHQASLVIHYLVQTHGFPKIVEMLNAWGQMKPTETVYRDVLKQSPTQIDEGFRVWLMKRYMNFQGQLLLDLAAVESVMEVQKALNAKPDDADLRANLAVAHYRDGKKDAALAALDSALKVAKSTPRVHLIAALIYSDLGRMKDAHASGNRVLEHARDSYDLRMIMGSAAQSLELTEEASIHFQAATELFPGGQDAWDALDRIALMTRNESLAVSTIKRLFELDAHDSSVARRYGERMLKLKNFDEARRAGQRWMDIAPFDARAHNFLAQVELANGNGPGAEQIWETALVIRKGEEREIILGAIKAAQDANQSKVAERWRQRALKLGMSERQIQRSLDAR